MIVWLDRIPLVGVYFFTMTIVLGAVAAGYCTGAWQSKRGATQGEGAIGSTVAAMLGLLAFLMAFTFGATASRFDTRRQLLLDEVNAIGTADLRTAFLPEPQRARCKQLLRSYVDQRADPDNSPSALQRRIEASEKILDQLWAETASLAEARIDPPLRSLFVQAINETIDLHTSRVTVGVHYRIPDSIWFCLYGATFCAMFGVGYHFGLATQKKVLIHLLLAALFSMVVLLIADLDRANEGYVKVDQLPMQYLQTQLNETANVSQSGVVPAN